MIKIIISTTTTMITIQITVIIMVYSIDSTEQLLIETIFDLIIQFK